MKRAPYKRPWFDARAHLTGEIDVYASSTGLMLRRYENAEEAVRAIRKFLELPDGQDRSDGFDLLIQFRLPYTE